ncbi:reverse transcriptase domain-containing protein, partial [Tanacetum coccineum]
MSDLKFADTLNLVAFLEKPTESEGFEDIVDFLNANPIKYALTVNPTIYCLCVKQFWDTVKAKTVNEEVQLQALVDKKKVIITESIIRRDLQLEDANGVDWLKRLRKVGRTARIESSKDEGLGAREDASKQRRKITDLDADVEVTLVDEAQRRIDDNLIFDTGVFDEQEVEVEKAVSTAEVTTVSATTTTVDELTLAQTLIEIKAAKPKAVTSAATITKTAVTRPKARGVVVQEPSEFRTTTSSLQTSQLPQVKDKGKAKMIEPDKPLKKKDQILVDEEIAQRLQEELQAKLEEEERFQAEEQGELSIEEDQNYLVEIMDKRNKALLQRLELKRSEGRKPPTKAQKRKSIVWYGVILKVMFEPDVESEVWEKSTSDTSVGQFGRLFSSSGVTFCEILEICISIAGRKKILMKKLEIQKKNIKFRGVGIKSFLMLFGSTENVAADHLSRIENDESSDDSDVDDNFPGETLMEINTKDEPWFTHFANYLVADIIPKGMTYQQKNKFFSDLYLFKVCYDEAQALPTNDARVVVTFLKKLFCRFGMPKALISDRDTHFCNKIMERTMKRYGVNHRFSTSYHPQTSGQVENTNKALKRILEKTVKGNPAIWSRKLDDALWAFRTAYKTPTGTTPYKLIYGKNCHLPFEIEHHAYWALKNYNPDLIAASEKRMFQLHELDELRHQAYENSRLYKART